MTEAYFRSRVPKYIDLLLADFPVWDLEDCYACMGNGGHESGGFTNLQEDNPTIKGSRGGFGWFQWTGPRRRAYEAYCARNNLNPAHDDSNYKWLFIELRGSESAAVAATARAATLKDKVVAFEKNFERAGIKHYDSRLRWALIAKDAYEKHLAENHKPQPKETEEVKPEDIAKAVKDAMAQAPATTPIALPAPKPDYGFQTIGSGLTGLASSLIGAYFAYKSGNMELLMTSVTAAGASIGAIFGRIKAATKAL